MLSMIAMPRLLVSRLPGLVPGVAGRSLL